MGLINVRSVISDSAINIVTSILVVSLKNITMLPSRPLTSASVLTFLDPALTIDAINIPSVELLKYAAFNSIAPSRNIPLAPISKTAVSSWSYGSGKPNSLGLLPPAFTAVV